MVVGVGEVGEVAPGGREEIMYGFMYTVIVS